MATANVNLFVDTTLEQNTRAFYKGWGAQFAAMGLVRASDTGQVNWDRSLFIGSSVDASSPTSYVPYNAIDNSTTQAWRSAALPTVGAPQFLVMDAGVGQTYNMSAGSIKIYTTSIANDPKDFTVWQSDDYNYLTGAGTWSQVTMASTALTSSTGYQTINVSSGGASKRFLKLQMTSTQSGTGYVQVMEWQAFGSAAGAGTQYLPIRMAPTGGKGSIVVGTEIWRLNDTLQSTSPVFLKVEYGTTSSFYTPQVTFSLGSATDGYGNLYGQKQTQRKVWTINSLFGSQLPTMTPYSCLFSGSTNRISGVIARTLTSGWFWFNLERTKDANGDDTAEGAIFSAHSSTTGRGMITLLNDTNGQQPNIENDLGCLVPAVGTSLYNSETSLYKVIAFTPKPTNPMVNIWAYINSDFNQDSTDTLVDCYGDTHTYYFVGNQVTSMARGITGSRLAIVWE